MSEPSGNDNLIEKCKKGERKAQEQLYMKYNKAMYNICLRLLNNDVEAEDVMQEAFLAAFLKINTYRGEVSFGSWLKRIVINKAIDVLRSKKMQLEEIDERMEYADNMEDDHKMDDKQTAAAIERIRQSIKMLPDGFRAVLSLFFFEGYDHTEIAQILGVSESTSRSQMVRARRRLVEILNKSENETSRPIH